jgi:hypothetical protein
MCAIFELVRASHRRDEKQGFLGEYEWGLRLVGVHGDKVDRERWCSGAEAYKPRERIREALTCKLMGRPASSRVGSAQERWLVVFCLLGYKRRKTMVLSG